MFSFPELAMMGATFLLAGGVKGIIGMGLPTVSLAILTATLGLQPAMALLLVPTLVTNLWQTLVGGQLAAIARRLWPFLLASMLAVWPGVMVLARVDERWLSLLLGGLITGYALANLGSLPLSFGIRRKRGSEKAYGLVNGMVNGLVTGMTGSSVFPGVAYLQSLGLPRDQLIQAMGTLFILATLMLGLAMGSEQLLSGELLGFSSLAVLPALVGMNLGQRVRRRLSEASFRRFFFLGLLVMGSYLILRSLIVQV